jgi:hypothetical protein
MESVYYTGAVVLPPIFNLESLNNSFTNPSKKFELIPLPFMKKSDRRVGFFHEMRCTRTRGSADMLREFERSEE